MAHFPDKWANKLLSALLDELKLILLCFVRVMGVLYQFVKYASRVGFPLYFGRLEINGRANIPDGQPYILAPNHQNAFMDAILTAVHCDTEVSFLTRSDVFVKPFDTILHAVNMMPVYRLRDGYEKLKKNEEIFAHCNSLLGANKPVLIFPEGNMGPGHAMRPLTKGTARMAFQAQAEIDKDLLIVPVGINYFHHDNPWSKAILNYGSPIRVRDYLEIYDANKAKGLIALKNELSTAISDLMLIPKSDDDYGQKVKHLHYNNEHLRFSELKKHIAQNPVPTMPQTHPQFKWLSHLLSIPNIGPLYLIHKIIAGLTDTQFTGSLKYVLGLVTIPLWWIVVGLIAGFLHGWDCAVIAICFCVSALFLRAAIQKKVR